MFQSSYLWQSEDQHLLHFCESVHSQQKNQDFTSLNNLNINTLLINYIKNQIPNQHLHNSNLVDKNLFQLLNYKFQINVQSTTTSNFSHSYFTHSSYFLNINDLLRHFRLFIQHFLLVNKTNNQFSIYVPSLFFISDKTSQLQYITLNNSNLEQQYLLQQNHKKKQIHLTSSFPSQKLWISNFNYKFLQKNQTKYVNLQDLADSLTDQPNIYKIYSQIISDILNIYQKQILVQFPFSFKYLICKKSDLKKLLFANMSCYQAIYLQADYIHEQSILIFKLGLIDKFDKNFIFLNKNYIFLIELYNNLTIDSNLSSILEYIEPYIVKLQSCLSLYSDHVQFYIKDIITQHDFFCFLLYYIFTLNLSTLQMKEFEVEYNKSLQHDILNLKNKIFHDRDFIKNSSLQQLQSFLSSSQI